MRNVAQEPTGEMPIQDVYQGALDINEAFTGRPGSAVPLPDPSNIGGNAKPLFPSSTTKIANDIFGPLGGRQKTVGATPPLPITPQIY
jgi:hypothetical protein